MVITLLTDFGSQDEYVGVMKGVILSVNPKAALVDLSHQVPPGDVVKAGWLLRFSWSYFPPETIHVAVVDPGVGSRRRILCVKAEGHLFLAPDNGLLSYVLAQAKKPLIWLVSNRRYALPKISHTFHGRDIFAPAAGYLSRGLSPGRLGPRVRTLRRLPVPTPRVDRGGLFGEVILIDRFGNAVTNLPKERVDRLGIESTLRIQVKDRTLRGICSSYGSVKPRTPVAVFDSHDLLEIALCQGSAQKELGLRVGDKVWVKW